MIYYVENEIDNFAIDDVYNVVDFAYNHFKFPSNTRLSIEWIHDFDLAGEVLDEKEYDDVERWFTIYINSNQSKVEIIKTLFHELTHIRQFCDGVLPAQEIEGVSYKEYPWEIEAYKNEELLYEAYATQI